jgi:GT2 family glycosyltransferase
MTDQNNDNLTENLQNGDSGNEAARSAESHKSTPPLKISIIIPLHICGERFLRDFSHIRSLEYPDFEILIVADEPNLDAVKRLERPGLINIISTGEQLTGPAEKRDMAIEKASGSICAFIDDDAYPRPDWLRNVVKYFEDPEVGAVGGPGITPPEDSLTAQASGAVYASPLGSGQTLHRFIQRKGREVEDYPAYNLFVRTELLKKIGGFATTYYGGEDTKLCLEIIRTGKKILYRPDVVIFHHRRPLFFGHLKQIANVGLHRGYFAKMYPETSWRLFYFLPSILVMTLAFGLVLSMFSNIIAATLLLSFAGYFAVALVSTMPTSRLSVALLGATGIMLSHFVYGCAFIRGLTIKDLDR